MTTDCTVVIRIPGDIDSLVDQLVTANASVIALIVLTEVRLGGKLLSIHYQRPMVDVLRGTDDGIRFRDSYERGNRDVD